MFPRRKGNIVDNKGNLVKAEETRQQQHQQQRQLQEQQQIILITN
ncbi:MAG TPA: hypothetical protein VE619_08220 [Nitrososphaeraceae archaeon]|jgi:hypothetical protein|nr:hypothetical protein [Nitrososphaeraceae archaeon]